MKTVLVIATLTWAAFLLSGTTWAAAEHDHAATEAHGEHDHDDHGAEDADHGEEDHEDHGEDGHDGHGEEQSTTITRGNADESGITTAIASGGTLTRSLKTYGRVVVPSDQISHIRARFPGLIRAVGVSIGDTVDAGDELATIEANESLKRYSITAPIGGIVTERHANAGELAQDQVLFSIVNPARLWAELRVFEGQLSEVRADQVLTLSSATQEAQSVIKSMIPSLDEHPFVVARAELDNQDGVWSPGMFVEGDIVVETLDVPLMVDSRAIQTLDGERGVFTQQGDRYEFHPLTLGRSDRQFIEVLEGLLAGARYVVENSYLIKADIEKSGAAHEH